jgi:dihydroorotate dehydrogenase (fumarate)
VSLLERAVAAVDVPVIGSLNGVTPGGWADYAAAMQDAGAAAIELNIYYLPGDTHTSGRDVEQRHLDVLARVKDAVTVPVAVKLAPYFSSTGGDGAAAGRGRRGRAGALQPVPTARHRRRDARGGLGRAPLRPIEARLPRTWIALLRGRVRASLAATTGVETSADVAKYLLAGADVVMTASALLRHGPEHAADLLDGLSDWMDRKGYATVDELRGSSRWPPDADGDAHERASYVGALRNANRGAYDSS